MVIRGGIFVVTKWDGKWEILQLTDEMKLKTTESGNEYILLMKKIK